MRGKTYTLLNVIGSPTIPEGKYLFDRGTGQVEKQWIQGIGSDQATAPRRASCRWSSTES